MRILLLILLSGCATSPQMPILMIECIERLLDKSIEAKKATLICGELYKRR